ncbi:monovalent cation/H+ antiporter subunit D family protein [Sneathiella sp. CAU 1612]|uniref:Monovalent cation/H+ antiporter subunit D family protein n=1 Tax=Sneathiella sedimenti TaxID=2816034 RepID=A0ABS3F9S5_9PROT|nr:monovalent cation/H+ antiporter subunit D family protein [Sneathiella sedimenti]MBO0335093.1 monovalent cation/H+ antiporter subunit D family protein [Sneathiella sedimenti]
MFALETHVALSLIIPLVGAIGIAITSSAPNIRETVTLVTSVLLCLNVFSILPGIMDGAEPAVLLVELLPDIALTLKVEPLGMTFAAVASSLWIINSIYSIGYMRGNNEPRQTGFYICFAIAIAATMGVAFSGNLLTLFVFYEVLTLSTYPLVTHKKNADALKGGRIYLGILIGTSIGLFLPAIIWTWTLAGTVDFVKGGILSGHAGAGVTGVLLFLFMYGIGKAALMPIHRWLPAAMVAPTPVSALLHAVAVVKAGVFSVLKVVIYIFGIDFLTETGAAEWLTWVAAYTLIAASVVALTKDNLKARLAYSTISQLAYVVLGASMATSMAVAGGALQIVMHAFGKITLFFCAGAIYTAVHKTEISDMRGLGRQMPITFIAFLIGSLSIIGLPPLGGSWSKFYLMLGAAEADEIYLMIVLLVSSLLNIAYLLPIVARAFFYPPLGQIEEPTPVGYEKSDFSWRNIQEAPLFCVLPPVLTALACVVLFFLADPIVRLIEPILTP